MSEFVLISKESSNLDEERRIEVLRHKVIDSNDPTDMQEFYKACAKWFQQRHLRAVNEMDYSKTQPAQHHADAAVDAFMSEVRAELIRARTKFPGDRIMTIALAEEFGELCKAVLEESSENVRKEAVQTAVMCARVVLDGDGSVNSWREERGLDPLVSQSTDQPAQPIDTQPAWTLADKVRADLDRQSCPDTFMRIAVESIVKHFEAQRSDTEMLDWLIEHEGRVIKSHSGFRVSYRRDHEAMGNVVTQDFSSNPREAIKAAMRADREGS